MRRREFLAALGGGVYTIVTSGAQAYDLSLRVGGPIIPPYWEMQDGKPAGSLVDLMTKVMAEAGFGMTADVFPSARLAHQVIAAEVDLVIMMRHSKLDETPILLRSADPIAVLWLNLYSHREPFRFRAQTDLRGQTIVVVRGYGYGTLRSWLDQPENRVTLIEVNDAKAALLMVSAGRAPLALAYDINYDHTVAQLGGPLPDVVTNPLAMLPAHLYLNRDSVRNPEAIMAAIVAAHGRLIVRGALPEMPGHDVLFAEKTAAP